MLIYEVNIIPFFILLMKKLKPREFIIIDQGHTQSCYSHLNLLTPESICLIIIIM